MKKIALTLILIMLFSLCACRSNNQTDKPTSMGNSSDITSSNTSSVTSDFSLPERDDPTESTTQSDNNSSSELESEENTSSILSVTKNLTLETEKPYYKTSTAMINIVLHNDGGIFNYYTDFFLQRYENGDWEYVDTSNNIIDYKFNIATSTSNVEFITYDTRKLYSTPLPTGKYRFIQESDSGTIVSNSFELIDNISSDAEQPQ